MNLQKIYILSAVIRRTEIYYLENKNGHGWVQLHVGGMVFNGRSGRGFRVGLICGFKTLPL